MKELIVAKNIGFCFGVRRTVKITEKLLKNLSSLYTIGDIVHNPLVIEKFKKEGLIVCKKIEEIKGRHFLIRSHGLPKKEIEKIREKGIKIYDTTCPFVKKIHGLIENLDERGYAIIIIGEKNHPEVIAAKNYGKNVYVLDKKEKNPYILKRFNKIAIVGQTTLNFDYYFNAVKNLILRIKTKEILVYNTICKVSEIRQEEGKEISKKVDAVLVLGGKKSSNTKKLFQVCKKINKNTFHIENFSDLSKIYLNKFKSIGILSGTSTPDFFIDEVIEYLKNNYKEVKGNDRNKQTAGGENIKF